MPGLNPNSICTFGLAFLALRCLGDKVAGTQPKFNPHIYESRSLDRTVLTIDRFSLPVDKLLTTSPIKPTRRMVTQFFVLLFPLLTSENDYSRSSERALYLFFARFVKFSVDMIDVVYVNCFLLFLAPAAGDLQPRIVSTG